MSQNKQNISLNAVERATVKTVAYFDIFDYPLTTWECWKWLYQNSASVVEVAAALENLVSGGVLAIDGGFYFLAGRQKIAAVRRKRYNVADHKYSLAARAAKAIGWLPSVRLVAVCNNVALSNARAYSDIDFFIVAKAGQLWITRLLVSTIIHFFGLRRHSTRVANRICLSFYISDNNYNLDSISLKPDDPYLYYWISTLTPIYDDKDVFDKLWLANSWVKDFLPNTTPKKLGAYRLIDVGKKIPSGLSAGLEGVAKKLQLAKMSRNTSSVAHEPDSRVIISDTMLKFHEKDNRSHYRSEWLRRLSSLSL